MMDNSTNTTDFPNASFGFETGDNETGIFRPEIPMYLRVPEWNRLTSRIYIVVVFVIGVLGNSILIAGLRRKKTKKSTDIYSIFKSVVDMTAVAINCPVNFARFTPSLWDMVGSDWLCKLHFYIQHAVFLASSFLVVSIGVDRYVKVFKPLVPGGRLKTTSKIVCILSTVLSVGLCIPAIFTHGSIDRICKKNQSLKQRSLIRYFGPIVAMLMVTLSALLGVIYFKIGLFLRRRAESKKTKTIRSNLPDSEHSPFAKPNDTPANGRQSTVQEKPNTDSTLCNATDQNVNGDKDSVDNAEGQAGGNNENSIRQPHTAISPIQTTDVLVHTISGIPAKAMATLGFSENIGYMDDEREFHSIDVAGQTNKAKQEVQTNKETTNKQGKKGNDTSQHHSKGDVAIDISDNASAQIDSLPISQQPNEVANLDPAQTEKPTSKSVANTTDEISKCLTKEKDKLSFTKNADERMVQSTQLGKQLDEDINKHDVEHKTAVIRPSAPKQNETRKIPVGTNKRPSGHGKEAVKPGASGVSGNANREMKRVARTTLTMALLTFVFIVSTVLPAAGLAVNSLVDVNSENLNIVVFTASNLPLLGNAANPILFAMSSAEFRELVASMFSR